jgi:hypothetical protein
MDLPIKTKVIFYGFAITALLFIAGLLFSWMQLTIIAAAITLGALFMNGYLIAKKVFELYNQDRNEVPASEIYDRFESA